MSLVDRLLDRHTVMFTSPLPVAECQQRIGPNSRATSLFGSGANGTSPFMVGWTGDNEVMLTKPYGTWSRHRAPRCSMRVQFDAQPEGTFVAVTAGIRPWVLVNAALLWVFIAGAVLLGLGSQLHGGRNDVYALAFAGLFGPLAYGGARSAIARQGPEMLSTLESLLAAPITSSLQG